VKQLVQASIPVKYREEAFEWLRDNNKTNAITILCDRGERYLSCL